MQEQYPEPEIKTSKAAYTVWLLPFIALILAIFLIYKNINEAGINIYVTFPDANGIVAKKTAVKFRGIEVGRVRTLTALQDGSGVLANIEMQKDIEPYLTDKLKFWLVKPNVGFSGISGLDTLLSGAYIQVDGGQEVLQGNTTRYFRALVGAPPVDIPQELMVYTLVTNNAAGVTTGSLVYHRDIIVGSVRHVKLSDDHKAVEVTVAIEPEYKGLVKMHSRFWSVSGFKASLDLSGVKMQSAGFIPMLIGGVAFSSPFSSQTAPELTAFRLYSDAEAARDSLEIKLKFAASAPVRVGTAIMLDQQKVGSIDSLEWDDAFSYLTGTAKLSMDIASLMHPDTQFWLETPGLSIDSVEVTQLLQGTIIRLSPGLQSSEPPIDQFTVLSESPYQKWAKSGLHLSLNSEHAEGLAKGSGIFYRSERIGEVEWLDFSPQTRRFIIDARIYPRYENMVDENSQFYNLSGIAISANLQSVEVKVPSLGQLISGGIGVHLAPEHGKAIADKSEKKLYRDLKSALAANKEGLLRFSLRSEELIAVAADTPVYYKDFVIGKTIQTQLADDVSASIIEIEIDLRHQSLVRKNSRFWLKSAVDIRADLAGVKVTAAPLLAMLGGGISLSERDPESPVASSKDRFPLFADKDSAFASFQTVTLNITKPTSLKSGASVKYRGHDVGKVVATALLPNLDGIKATIQLDEQYAEHFNRIGSRYWLVQPMVSLHGIKNVATAVFGDHLAVEKGSGELQSHFKVNQSNLANIDGLAISLEAEQLGSLDAGDPILYKQLRIGEVTEVGLTSDKKAIMINVVIYPQFQSLITTASQFWNASGIKVQASLFGGVNIDTQTLESIVAGGIAMVTDPAAPRVDARHVFKLLKQSPVAERN